MKPKYLVDGDGNEFYVKAKMKTGQHVRGYCVSIKVCNDTRRFWYKSFGEALGHYLKLGNERSIATVEKVSEYEIEIQECKKRKMP